MIRDILNRRFVLARMRQLMEDLEQKEDARGGSGGRESVAQDAGGDYEGVRAALIEASRRQPEEHLLNQTPAAASRGPSVPPLDEEAFFSRDAMTSIVQSALEQYYEEREPELVQEEPAGVARRGGAAPESPVTERRLDPPARSRALGRFEITDPIWLSDPRWVNSKIAEGWRLFRGKRPFNDEPAAPVGIRDNARLLLVGDWGTGLKRAQNVAAEMRKVIEEGEAQGREQHVVHLGDAYYSGWQREYEKRFLPYWPVRPGEESERLTSWSCNANHDMYSGGYGYFDCLLKDRRFALQERSSYFSLENDHWQILGLDTAWEDHALKDPQVSWIEKKLGDLPNRKTMLLSHHQPFSAYDVGGENELEVKLRGVLGTGRVDAWFWGHEHRCVLYKPHGSVRYGRCIGHGGVPVYRDRGPLPEPGVYQYREYFDAGWEDWALLGFAVLDLEGPTIRARYVDEFGRTHKEETIE